MYLNLTWVPTNLTETFVRKKINNKYNKKAFMVKSNLPAGDFQSTK